MNSTAVNPQHRPNLCACGHDIRVHNLTVSPNTCSICAPNTTAPDVHDFTPYHQYAPTPTWFPSKAPPGMVCAGGGPGGYVSGPTTLSGVGNALGNITLTMVTSQPGVKVGMTIITNPNNLANQASYVIRAISANGLTYTLDRPLLVATNSVRCTFAGILGSMMGPGLPPNGQRAG